MWYVLVQVSCVRKKNNNKKNNDEKSNGTNFLRWRQTFHFQFAEKLNELFVFFKKYVNNVFSWIECASWIWEYTYNTDCAMILIFFFFFIFKWINFKLKLTTKTFRFHGTCKKKWKLLFIAFYFKIQKKCYWIEF